MATDGIKIIDSDTARDTYWSIMDLYDNDASVETIKIEIPLVKQTNFGLADFGFDEDFDYEVFATAYALAFWEIGAIDEKILEEVRSVIDKGATVRVWSEYDPQAGKARQQELEKFWKKINNSNSKIRKRKKYREVTNFYFQPDDLVVTKLGDSYRALICSAVWQYRGQCDYLFVPTTYDKAVKPTAESLLDYEILGTRIACGYSDVEILRQQPGVDNLWKLFPEPLEFFPAPTHFLVGLVEHVIPHKSMIQLKSHFERIGKLRIKGGFKSEGSRGLCSGFEMLENYLNIQDEHLSLFHQCKFPIRLMCE